MESRAPRPWLRLDNAAKLFPSVTSDRLTNLFRLAVRLEEEVRPDDLAQALRAVAPRFPSFQFRLKAGFFWYSLVEDSTPPEVFPESSSPCLPFRTKARGLFRVRWFGRRLAVEFSHSLTDGVGALVFLRALTAEYLWRRGVECVDPDDLRRVGRPPEPAEAVDDFQRLSDPRFPKYQTWDRAFQLRGTLLAKGGYAVTTGRIPLGAALAEAKMRQATLTEFLAATLLAALQEVFLALPAREQWLQARPLRLVLPVNLRIQDAPELFRRGPCRDRPAAGQLRL